MFLGSGAVAQQLGDSAIQPAQRIGIIPLALRLNLRVLRVPTRSTAEIPVVIKRQNGSFLKWRCKKRRSRVSLMMLHYGDLRLGELIAQDAVHLRLGRTGERPHNRNAFHRIAVGSGQTQTLRNRRLGQPAGPPHMIELVLFDRCLQLAIFQYGTRRVPQQPTQAQNHHYLVFASILAHVSRSATVRLNTSFSRELSGSTAK